MKSNYGPMWNKPGLLTWHQLEMCMIVLLSAIFCQAPMVVQAKSEVSAQWPRDTYGKSSLFSVVQTVSSDNCMSCCKLLVTLTTDVLRRRTLIPRALSGTNLWHHPEIPIVFPRKWFTKQKQDWA